MKNTYLQANLVSFNRINVLLFTSVNLPNNPKFVLEKDGGEIVHTKIAHHTSSNSISIYDLIMDEEYQYGHSYVLYVEGFIRINVEVSQATEFPEFEDQFYYDGNDLGAIYSPKETKFALWAPLASSVELKIEENGEFHLYKMERTYKGVYRVNLKGDYLNARYHYLVTNSGVTNETNDIYCPGTSLNSEYSVVVDIDKIKKMPVFRPENKLPKPGSAIVYETCVRDFTEDKSTNIVNKGKFLGMTESGRKTVGGHPAGLDYLKLLGITHVQLLPISDFYGNDDLDNSKSYNWGYNPLSFFAIEGSYATNPKDAMNRLYEFRTLVDTLHKNNIRVIMDVVYNHVYEYMNSYFEKIVPNYYFRKRNNGLPSLASGCGNDFASEKKMARKIILDSLRYFTEVFDIDGFRFDLMGLMDIETVNKGYEICKALKNDTIFYGEGWNMGVELPFEKKACSENADKMKNIGFFNDLYRDTIKGANFRDRLSEKGFVGGNISQNDVVNYVLRGSTIDVPFGHRFSDYNQSVNYVECHDNNTLFDKLCVSNEDEDISLILRRVMFATELVLLSFGIAFIHMGQEIGLSKSGLDNTYNVLKVNNMNWKLVDERFEMVENFIRFVKIRKYFQEHFKLTDEKGDTEVLETQYWGNGVLCYSSEKRERIGGNQKVAVLINPTTDSKSYELDDYYSIFLDVTNKKRDDSLNMKNGILSPLTVLLLFKK